MRNEGREQGVRVVEREDHTHKSHNYFLDGPQSAAVGVCM